MESTNLKTLKLLEAIAANRSISQRELSDSLQMSLGLVNSFIKRLVKKGYCKVTTIPKNRVKYILTPEGAMEKTRLTYEYILSSYQYFKQIKNRLQDLYVQLQNEGKRRVAFYGIGEVAEIALISMKGTEVRLIEIVDPANAGETFANLSVKRLSNLQISAFDVLLITRVENHDTILKEVQQFGIPQEKIRFID